PLQSVRMGGDRLYAVIGAEKKAVVAVDERTGVRAWTAPVAEHPSGDNTVVVEAVGRLVVGAVTDDALNVERTGLVALEDGVVRWRRSLLNPTVAAVAGGRLFAASLDSVLHQLDPATGETVWSTRTPGPVNSLQVTPGMVLTTIGAQVTAHPVLR
ncbi:MAG TPA: PQQ-binding-like beta-propeller repeat protein, partial [Actinoplanes sp.]|nr:PQQ-binding-like beta-propeller repeat protein [Actinoplanes sp.]